MEQQIDIYNEAKLLEQTIVNLDSADITEKNKKLILKFQQYRRLQNMGKARARRYIIVLKHLAQYLNKDFDKAKKSDIERVMGIILQRDLSPNTKKTYKVMLKRFYKWLKGKDEEYPKEVRWIKTTIKRCEEKLPSEEELLTEEEIKKLISVAHHPRDKAFISILYECGCRVGELATLKIKNISFDEYGVLISLSGKTGSRKVRVISSVPYLNAWLQNHKYKDDSNAPLWLGIGAKNSDKPIKYIAIQKLLNRLFTRANIHKKRNAHFFRHSRATFMANHLTEFQMNQYFGWIQGSKMPSVYVHLSGKETDNAILELNGINVKKEKKESLLKPQKCPRCDTINSHDSQYCSKCAGPLNIKLLIELEEKRAKEREDKKEVNSFMDSLIDDPDFKSLLARKMGKMKLEVAKV